MSDMKELRTSPISSCPICGHDGAYEYHKLADNLFGVPGEWSFRKCSDNHCGILWLDPRPGETSIHLAYQSYYTHGSTRKSLVFRLAKRCYRLVVDALQFPFGITRERKSADIMYLSDSKPGTLLDVGCGDGSFLSRMASRGWRVNGVDFDEQAAAAARDRFGIDVRVAELEDLLSESTRFDVITADHVIEHVPSPQKFLSQAAELLRPGGCIVIRTPNVNSYGHSRYGEHWRGLEPPRHFQLFSDNALVACAEGAGLRVERCVTTAVNADFILGESHILERSASTSHRAVIRGLSRFVSPLLAVRAKLAWWSNVGSGEEIVAVFRRSGR